MRKVRWVLIFIVVLLSASELYGQSYSDYENQAVLERQRGNHAEVVKLATRAIETDPNEYYAYELRAKAQIELGNKSEAIADFTSAISRGGKSYYDRAQLKREFGDLRGAIDDYTQVIELNPTKDLTHYEPIQAGSSPTGEQLFVEDRKLYLYDRPYFFRGTSYFNLGEYRQAIADFTKVIDLTPLGVSEYYITSLYNRGYAKVLIGQKESGCRDLSKAGDHGYTKAYEIIRERCN